MTEKPEPTRTIFDQYGRLVWEQKIIAAQISQVEKAIANGLQSSATGLQGLSQKDDDKKPDGKSSDDKNA